MTGACKVGFTHIAFLFSYLGSNNLGSPLSLSQVREGWLPRCSCLWTASRAMVAATAVLALYSMNKFGLVRV